METASKRSIAGVAAILVILGALAVLPIASANVSSAVRPTPGTGVCYAGPNPGYDECYGVATDCGGGDGIGLAHWYYDSNGGSYTWCYQYVDPPFATTSVVNFK